MSGVRKFETGGSEGAKIHTTRCNQLRVSSLSDPRMSRLAFIALPALVATTVTLPAAVSAQSCPPLVMPTGEHMLHLTLDTLDREVGMRVAAAVCILQFAHCLPS